MGWGGDDDQQQPGWRCGGGGGGGGGFVVVRWTWQAADVGAWKHDMFSQLANDAKSAASSRLEAGSSILVSNLDTVVSAEDVKTIFGALGEVVKAVVNYDKDGTSLGTAEVTFAKPDDAQKAVEEYDGAEVDGRAMYIKVISTLLPPPPKQLVVTPSAAKIAQQQMYQQQAQHQQQHQQHQQQQHQYAPRPSRSSPRQFNVVRGNGRGRGTRGRGAPASSGQSNRGRNAPARGRGGGGGGGSSNGSSGRGRGAGRGRGRGGSSRGGKQKDVSAKDLDAELDSYHSASGVSKPADAVAAGQPAPKAPAAAPAAKSS